MPRAKNEKPGYRSGWCENANHVKCRTALCTCTCHRPAAHRPAA